MTDRRGAAGTAAAGATSADRIGGARGRAMSLDHATPFAQPILGTREQSLAAKISGKATRFLARNIHTRALAMRNARPLVTFTFDDAPLSACTVGASILERNGGRGTYYVSGGGCGASSPCGRLAGAGQLKLLCASGHEIGCHTYSHLAVARVDARELAGDLDRNRSFLTGISDRIFVRNFAYPYGDYSFPAKRRLQARFDSCRSLIPGVNSGIIDLGVLKTWALENASLDRLRICELLAQTAKTKGWLIFSSHDVDERPSRYGVTPNLFAFAVAAAREAGCLTVTVAEGLKIASGEAPADACRDTTK